MRALMLLVVALLGSSCGQPCTLIGCTNSVSFVLNATMNQAFGLNEGVTVKVCVGGTCQTGVLTDTGSGTSSSTNPALELVSGSGQIRHSFTTNVSVAQDVSIELTKNGTAVGSDTRSGVTFTESRPNGPACPPVCQSATITL